MLNVNVVLFIAVLITAKLKGIVVWQAIQISDRINNDYFNTTMKTTVCNSHHSPGNLFEWKARLLRQQWRVSSGREVNWDVLLIKSRSSIFLGGCSYPRLGYLLKTFHIYGYILRQEERMPKETNNSDQDFNRRSSGSVCKEGRTKQSLPTAVWERLSKCVWDCFTYFAGQLIFDGGQFLSWTASF